jgi:hypothetical protein
MVLKLFSISYKELLLMMPINSSNIGHRFKELISASLMYQKMDYKLLSKNIGTFLKKMSKTLTYSLLIPDRFCRSLL